MKVACSLLLSCLAVSAWARDSAEVRRDRLALCSQFVIEEFNPAIIRDATNPCCRVDCQVVDLEDAHHWPARFEP
jgi:hypothetical protein